MNRVQRSWRGCNTAIADFFEETINERGTHVWLLRVERLDPQRLEELVDLVAAEIMRYRCNLRVDRFEAWRARADGGPAHDEFTETSLKVIIGTGVGLPDQPRSEDHLEGFVGEHLWYLLALEIDDEDIVRIDGPSIEVTEIGGDGLVVHRTDGALTFRLWELKKYVGSADIKPSIRAAYRQLNRQGLRYLNKFALIGQYLDDPELADFYGRLMDYWIDATPQSAPGVSIASSQESVPDECFDNFPTYFPKFLDPPRCRGTVIAVDNLRNLAARVKDKLWSGL